MAGDKMLNKFVDKNKNKINLFLTDMYKILGNCFLAMDTIIYKDKLYICEIGLKINQDKNDITNKLRKVNLRKICYYDKNLIILW